MGHVSCRHEPVDHPLLNVSSGQLSYPLGVPHKQPRHSCICCNLGCSSCIWRCLVRVVRRALSAIIACASWQLASVEAAAFVAAAATGYVTPCPSSSDPPSWTYCNSAITAGSWSHGAQLARRSASPRCPIRGPVLQPAREKCPRLIPRESCHQTQLNTDTNRRT